MSFGPVYPSRPGNNEEKVELRSREDGGSVGIHNKTCIITTCKVSIGNKNGTKKTNPKRNKKLKICTRQCNTFRTEKKSLAELQNLIKGFQHCRQSFTSFLLPDLVLMISSSTVILEVLSLRVAGQPALYLHCSQLRLSVC